MSAAAPGSAGSSNEDLSPESDTNLDVSNSPAGGSSAANSQSNLQDTDVDSIIERLLEGKLDWAGVDWAGVDWTGLEWTAGDWCAVLSDVVAASLPCSPLRLCFGTDSNPTL